MNSEHQEEQAALHALGLLEDRERVGFENELARTPTLRALVRDLREASCALVCRAPVARPPSSLKERILASLDSRPAPAPEVTRFGWTTRALLPWAAAATLTVGLVWLAQLLLATRADAELKESQRTLAELTLQGTRHQWEAERLVWQRQVTALESQLTSQQREVARLNRDLQTQSGLGQLKVTALASMLRQSPQAFAVAVWNPERQEGLLQVEKLPPLLPGQDYQLWVIDPQYANPLDGGVFTVDPANGEARLLFRANQPVRSVNAFAVTLERKGGVPQAEGPFVLLGK